ncbi:MAG: HEPN domain-containing protein [Nitrospira sp.]|nr:HEPN domain-containing protein [Nitrospira sp.]
MVRRSRDIPQREQNETRMRRAWIWLNLSEKSESDDEKFIFLWIAFNAVYGAELPDTSDDDRITERDRLADFANKIVERDRERAIENMLWDSFSGPVRVLLENKFVFGPFWSWVQEREKPADKDWESKFKERKQRVLEALGRHDVSRVLEEVLARLYVLRNQIIHGGTTFAEGWGRDQLRDGRRIMETIMPLILQIMQDDIAKSPDSNVWGSLNYPRVGESERPE